MNVFTDGWVAIILYWLYPTYCSLNTSVSDLFLKWDSFRFDTVEAVLNLEQPSNCLKQRLIIDTECVCFMSALKKLVAEYRIIYTDQVVDLNIQVQVCIRQNVFPQCCTVASKQALNTHANHLFLMQTHESTGEPGQVALHQCSPDKDDNMQNK